MGSPFEGCLEERNEQLAHVDLMAVGLQALLEDVDPSVDVARAVVAMNHGDGGAVGRGDDIDALIGLAEVLLEHNHRER